MKYRDNHQPFILLFLYHLYLGKKGSWRISNFFFFFHSRGWKKQRGHRSWFCLGVFTLMSINTVQLFCVGAFSNSFQGKDYEPFIPPSFIYPNVRRLFSLWSMPINCQGNTCASPFFAVGSILGNPCTRLPRDHPPSGLECSVTKGISRELTGHNGHAWVDLLDGLDKPTATFPSFV